MKLIQTQVRKTLFALILMAPSVSWAVVIETDTHIITHPSSPVSTTDVIRLQVINKRLCFFSELETIRYQTRPDDNGVPTTYTGVYIHSKTDISSSQEGNSGCLALRQKMFEVFIGRLKVGKHKIYIYNDHYTPQDLDSRLIGSFNLTVTAENTGFIPETPQAGSIQSGVGIIRGWACDAKKVEIQFDDKPRIAISYGTSRGDTIGRCGDENNGYGMVVNWTALGKGSHQMKTFIDDNQVADVTFEVAGLDEDFIAGLSGTYQLEDFPAPGKSVTVEWSEADQNFIIIDEQ